MNSLVEEYRQQFPNDHRPDTEILSLLGQQNDQDGRYAGYSDFLSDYQKLKDFNKEANEPSLPVELGRGIARGYYGLKSTGEGALGLAAAKVGATDTAHSLLQSAQGNEEEAARNAPTIENISDVKSFGDFVHWFSGQAGEFAPNVAEMAATSAIGAVAGGAAGTAAEPGGGTIVGAGGGAIAGIVEKSAVKALIKKYLSEDVLESVIQKKVASGVVRDVAEQTAKSELGATAARLAQFSSGTVTRDALGDALSTEVQSASKGIAQNWGNHIAQGINFSAQSAGQIYNDLTKKKDVDPDAAINTAIFGGLVAGVPGSILPSYLTGKFIPGIALAKAAGPEAEKAVKNAFYKYLAKAAEEATKTVPGGVATMDMQSLVTMAAEKYAQGQSITDWSDQDWKSLENSSATGALMGGAGALVAGLAPKGKIDPIIQNIADAEAKRKAITDEPAPATKIVEATKISEPNAGGQATEVAQVPPTDQRPASPAPALNENQTREVKPDEPVQVAVSTQAPNGATGDDNNPARSGDSPLSGAAPAPTRPSHEPTPTQAASGNYPKEKVKVDGLTIAVENTPGSIRSGKDKDGNEWHVVMPATYGEIEGSKGADGDKVDAYLGTTPSDTVFVIDQKNPQTGTFDEHKSFINFASKQEAIDTYNKAFSDGSGPTRVQGVSEIPKAAFEEWVKSKRTKEPLTKPEPAPSRDTLAEERIATPATTPAPDRKADIAKELGDLYLKAADNPEDKATYDKIELLKQEQRNLEPQPPAEAPKAKRGRKPKPVESIVKVSDNTIVTDAQAAKLRELLASSHPASKVGMGSFLTPEFHAALIGLGVYHLEKGVRTFAAFSKAFINEIPDHMREEVLPRMKEFYDAARARVGLHDKVDVTKIIDFDNSTLTDEESAKGKHKPAYWNIRGDMADVWEDGKVNLDKVKELGEALTADSRSDKDSDSRSVTRRMTVFEKADGTVVVLPTWKDQKGEYRVGALPGESNGQALKFLLGQHHDNGEPNYTPIASIRVNTEAAAKMGKNYSESYHDLRDFRDALGRSAQMTLEDRRGSAQAFMQTQGVEGFKPKPDSQEAIEQAAEEQKQRDKVAEGKEEKTTEEEDALPKPDQDAGEVAEVGTGGEGGRISEGAAATADEPLTADERIDTPERTAKGELSTQATQFVYPKDEQKAAQLRNLTTPEVETLWTAMSAVDWSAPDAYKALADAVAEGGSELINIAKKIALQKTGFFDRMVESGPEKTFDEYGLQRSSEAQPPVGSDAGVHRPAEPSAVAQASSSRSDTSGTLGGRETDTKGVTPSAPDNVGQSRQESDGGNKVVGNTDESVRQASTAPKSPELSPVEKQRLDTTVARLNRLGLPTQLVQAAHDELAKAIGGAYDRAAKTATIFLRDTARPTAEDFRALLEEAGHHVFNLLPQAEQDRVAKALKRMTDADLGIDRYTRSENSNIQSEERLMAAVSKNIARAGFDPIKADSLAGQLVRFVKDIYLRSAMAIQRGLFSEEFTNPDLARRFVQNRLESFLAGDHARLAGWTDWLGGGKPTRAHEAQWHVNSTRALSERIENGIVTFDHAPMDSIAAVRFNVPSEPNLRFSTPEGALDPEIKKDNRKRGPELNAAAARLNLHVDILGELAEHPDIVALARAEKVSPDEFVRATLRLPDTVQKLDALNAAQEADGSPVKFGRNKRLADLDSSYRDEASIAAYNDIQHDHSRIASRRSADALALQEIKGKFAKQTEKMNKAHERSLSADAVSSDAYKYIRDELKPIFEPTTEESVLSSNRKGTEQILQQLDPDATLRKYADAFKSALESGDLKGERLFEKLDAIAKDPSIDLSQPVESIRDAMEGNRQLADLTEDSRRGRAMLAAVVNYAKRHTVEMLNLELRSNPEREAIVKEALKAEKDSAMKGVKSVARSATLKERAAAAYREERSKLNSLSRRAVDLDQRIKAADVADSIYQKHLDALSSQLGHGADFEFRDKAQYIVPEKPDATSAELREKGATHALALDTTGKITNPSDLEHHIIAQTNFIEHRDRAFAAGDARAHDAVYHFIKRSRDEITAYKNFPTDVRQAHRMMIGLIVSPEGKKLADGIGTASSKIFEKRVNHFTSVEEQGHETAQEYGWKNTHLENNLIDLMPKDIADPRRQLQQVILRTAKSVLEKASDLSEAFPGDENKTKRVNAEYARVKSELLSNPKAARLMNGRSDEFIGHLRTLLEHQEAVGQWEVGRVAKEGLGVRDERLMVKNPATGKMEPGVRRHVPVGPHTFPRTISNTFKVMIDALRSAGWATAADEFKEVQSLHEKAASGDKEAAAKLKSIESRYFHNADHADQIQRVFVGEMAKMDSESPFKAPSTDGTSTPADLNLVRQAWNESKGDIVKFAERLYDLHGGDDEGLRSKYVGETFDTISRIYKQIESFVPLDTKSGEQTLKGSSQNALIDARTLTHLPGSWFDYRTMDEKDLSRTNQRIAFEAAYGRNGEAGQSNLDTMRHESRKAQSKIKEATDEITSSHPEYKPKQIRAALESKLGGKEKFVIEKLAQGEKLVQSSQAGLSDFHRKENGPYATVRVWTRAARLLGGVMVSKPSSAIVQMAKLMDLNVNYGASPSMLSGTAKLIGGTAKELGASLLQSIGIQGKSNDDFVRRYINGGYADSGRVQTFRASTARIGNETPTSRAFRAISEIHELGINKVGAKAEHVVFRPLSLFTWVNKTIDRETTLALWRMADNRIADGVEYFKDHPEQLKDPTFKLTAEHLGLSSFEKDGFERMTGDMGRWFMDYNDAVRDAVKRDDGQMLTDKHLGLLQGLARSEIANEGNLSTMSTSVYNNSALAFAAPLITWGFRRAMQIAALTNDREGRFSMKRVGYGAAGLAVASMGGLALSSLLDEYYKDILGKQRNLQPPMSAMGALENLNRIGTFGMMGELADSVIGVGEGGDNRMLSLDRRIVAVSSLMSLYKAAQAFTNQGMTADYVHVVRPAFSSLGGTSALEYMQIANHALGLDNPESRVVARINAQNYLRVVGREMELDVRTMDGGYNNPTPVTPFLTKMELAAYANNPADFQQAYQAAIEKAKDSGHEDPVDYVKRAFQSRNPLRSVFKTAPNAQEYQQILGNLPADGRRDVSEAVRLVNSYGERIGVKPFEGSNKTEKPKQMYSADDFKTRATMAIGGY